MHNHAQTRMIAQEDAGGDQQRKPTASPHKAEPTVNVARANTKIILIP
jgi:hypothetical protein